MTERPTAAKGHMPFPGHRTCAEVNRDHAIITRHRHGWSAQAIAESLGISTKKVLRILRANRIYTTMGGRA